MAHSFGLVADVGGTNIRLQLVDLKTGEVSQLRKYLCADHPTIVAAIQTYLADCGNPDVVTGCIAIACPTNDDWIAMTNHSWAFSRQLTQAELGWRSLHMINDYTAIAMSLPHLDRSQAVQMGGGAPIYGAPIAVLGPGTGLGVAHLVQVDGKWQALPGEGGHVDFAPNSEEEIAILRFLMKRYAHVSVEQLLSGPGIVQIYEAQAEILGQPVVFTEAAEITGAALDERCPVAMATLASFCAILGSVAGNLALTIGAFGGVYVAGGIVPRFLGYFENSAFRQRFEAKGRFTAYNGRIPTFVVIEEQPGLVGARAYLMQTEAA